MPLQEVVKCGKPDFPFCLGWANHSWSKKNWNKDVSRFDNKVLIEQTYPGKEDIDNHFYTMLPMFSDRRYYRIHDKLLFYIYSPESIPDFKYFTERWQYLAGKNNLPKFYFVGNIYSSKDLDHENAKSLDAFGLDLKNRAFNSGHRFWRRLSYLFPFPIFARSYSYAIS